MNEAWFWFGFYILHYFSFFIFHPQRSRIYLSIFSPRPFFIFPNLPQANSNNQSSSQRRRISALFTLTSTMSAEEVANAFVQHFFTTFENGVDNLAGLFVSLLCGRSQRFFVVTLLARLFFMSRLGRAGATSSFAILVVTLI